MKQADIHCILSVTFLSSGTNEVDKEADGDRPHPFNHLQENIMLKTMKTGTPLIFSAAFGLLTFALWALPPGCMAWQRNVTRIHANGNTSNRAITGTRTANGYARNTVYTGPQGNTASRSAQGQWDPATRTWTKNVTATGPNGGTATRNSGATRTDNGYTGTTVATGPRGNTATRNTQGQWDPTTKTWTKTITTNGQGR